MALTVTQAGNDTVFGDRRVRFFDVVFDDEYPTGGEPLSLETLRVKNALAFLVAEPSSGYLFAYDRDENTLKALYFNTDAADGPAIEVPDTTDLSAVSTRVLVIEQV